MFLCSGSYCWICLYINTKSYIVICSLVFFPCAFLSENWISAERDGVFFPCAFLVACLNYCTRPSNIFVWVIENFRFQHLHVGRVSSSFAEPLIFFKFSSGIELIALHLFCGFCIQFWPSDQKSQTWWWIYKAYPKYFWLIVNELLPKLWGQITPVMCGDYV